MVFFFFGSSPLPTRLFPCFVNDKNKKILHLPITLYLKENDIKSLSRKNAARKAFTEGSFSTLSFIMFGGMEEEFLDSMLKAMKEVKVQKEKG